MNKKQFLTVCLSLLACLLSSCRDEMAEVSPEEQPDGSIVLTINTGKQEKSSYYSDRFSRPAPRTSSLCRALQR